jgi:hypothetical protein
MSECRHGENEDTCIICNEGQYEVYISNLRRELAEAQSRLSWLEEHSLGPISTWQAIVDLTILREKQVKVLVEALENLTKWNGHHNGPMLIDLMKHAENTLASIKETT